MKTKDLLGALSVATATACLTIAIGASGGLDAGGPNTASPTQIRKPTLVSHGIEVSARTIANQKQAAEQAPAIELVATNPTDQPATAAINITLNSTSPSDMMSRVPRMPKALWTGSKIVSLKAGETMTVPLDVAAKLPINSLVSVILNGDDASTQPNQRVLGLQPGVLALSFGTMTEPIVQTASTNLSNR